MSKRKIDTEFVPVEASCWAYAMLRAEADQIEADYWCSTRFGGYVEYDTSGVTGMDETEVRWYSRHGSIIYYFKYPKDKLAFQLVWG